MPMPPSRALSALMVVTSYGHAGAAMPRHDAAASLIDGVRGCAEAAGCEDLAGVTLRPLASRCVCDDAVERKDSRRDDAPR